MNSILAERVQFRDLDPPVSDMREEVVFGLSASPKYIPSKYFYDKTGSRLFEQITKLQEYYPTETEISILERIAPELLQLVGSKIFLVEYGSGSSRKVRILLEPLRPLGYMPIDISRDSLLESAVELAKDYPWLSVYPTSADYCSPVKLPEAAGADSKLAFFPGSSIGNFEPHESRNFLESLHQSIGSQGFLLIGVDRDKDVDVLESAYNDTRGVTAEFNLNILHHLNHQLEARLLPDKFQHKAVYNAEAGRIEMYLTCLEAHETEIGGEQIQFQKGEDICTEHSYKYSREAFIELAASCGFELVSDWSDSREYFSVFLFRAV